MYRVIGIDEAGKGPVIGSMFIGFSIINLQNGLSDLNSYQDFLKDMGVVDSKKLNSIKRNQIYVKLKEKMDLTYAQLTPNLIDDNYFKGYSLHELEIQAIVKVLEQQKPSLVLIDALTSKPEEFGENLKKRLSFDCKIISENKADLNHPIVAAASIAAKELREQELWEIKTNVHKILSPDSQPLASGTESQVGSGYPSDKKTQDFLKNYYDSKEFGFIFRKSWNTYQNVVEKKFHKTLDEHIEKENNN